MKKLKFLGVVAMATVLLTSCLDGGNNEQQYESYAVVKMSTKSFKMLAYENSSPLPIYHSQLEGLNEGQCIRAFQKINFDDPINSAGNDYYTASEFQYVKITTGNVLPVLEDTTAVKEKEIPVLDAALIPQLGTYIEGMLFVATSHPNSETDQQTEVVLSYNRGSEVEEVNGKRVYNLFLRAQKLTDGKNSTGNITAETAFPMSSFFSYASSIEKGKSQEYVHFRFNYIKEIDKDTKKAVWASTQVIDYPIPTKEN